MSEPWLPGEGADGGADVRRHAPATLRNREPIARELAHLLPPDGIVLEVASGSGEHVAFLAERFPHLHWQPSDPDRAALASIAAWTDDLANVAPPLALAATAADWRVDRVDAIFCANMVHIAPWSACTGLFAAAARHLNGPLILYGPFVEEGVATAPSNVAFDASLRDRDPAWGLRNLTEVDALASTHGFVRSNRIAMPANNLMLAYVRG